VSHRKISRGARAHLLSLFPPDGYVVVTVLDQTIAFLDAEGAATTRHPEAHIYRTETDALAMRDAERRRSEECLRRMAENAELPAEDRAWAAAAIERRDFDHDPWVEPVLVEAHFRMRRDTW
jgi:hypothetical protein